MFFLGGELQDSPSFSSWFDSGEHRELARLKIPEPRGSELGLFPADPSASGSRTTLYPLSLEKEPVNSREIFQCDFGVLFSHLMAFSGNVVSVAVEDS